MAKVAIEDLLKIEFEFQMNILNFSIERERINIVLYIEEITRGMQA